MTYRTGTWGKEAKERSRRRHSYFLKYRSKNKEKWKARAALDYLVRKGIIKKEKCFYFKKNKCHGQIEGHHPDYKKPLMVKWLCSLHHREEHKKIK